MRYLQTGNNEKISPPEVTKIFLQKDLQHFEKTQKCTCWPKELNQKGFPRNIQCRTRPKAPLQFFWSYATEWTLKNPKGSSLSVFFGMEIFQFFQIKKRFPNHQ